MGTNLICSWRKSDFSIYFQNISSFGWFSKFKKKLTFQLCVKKIQQHLYDDNSHVNCLVKTHISISFKSTYYICTKMLLWFHYVTIQNSGCHFCVHGTTDQKMTWMARIDHCNQISLRSVHWTKNYRVF